MFISFEGIDGSGKSTQIELLTQYLSNNDVDFEMLREPGSTTVGLKIRSIVLDNDNFVTPFAEVMLYATARAQLVEEKIIPLLNQKKLIICDRYVDSSIAYQGVRDIPMEHILSVNNLATRGIKPDITFYLRVSAKEGLSRVQNDRKGDRIEQEGINFFDKVVKNYDTIAKAETDRVYTLDGTKAKEDIHNEIINVLKTKNLIG